MASSSLLGTSPGDSSGLATESDHNAPKCPHFASGSWSVFLQATGSSVDDSTFTISCDACKYRVSQNKIGFRIIASTSKSTK